MAEPLVVCVGARTEAELAQHEHAGTHDRLIEHLSLLLVQKRAAGLFEQAKGPLGAFGIVP